MDLPQDFKVSLIFENQCNYHINRLKRKEARRIAQ